MLRFPRLPVEPFNVRFYHVNDFVGDNRGIIVKTDHPVCPRHIRQAGEGSYVKIDMDKEITREKRSDFTGAGINRFNLKTRVEGFDLTVLKL